METPLPSPSDPSGPSRRWLWPVGLLAAVLLLPELVLTGADLGLWGRTGWRAAAYSYLGFWPGLLHGWQPNYAQQPWAMFLGYGLLHAGPEHLAGNLAALVWLGPLTLTRTGAAGFWTIWGAAWLGGALGFGLLSRQPAPMVGASGALFGLAAALMVFALRRAPSRRMLGRVLAAVAGLALLNLAIWWLEAGRLAWQTHLGGAIAGALVALALPMRVQGRFSATRR